MDAGFKNPRIIDAYSTFLWTERYSNSGDFVLELPNTPRNRLAVPIDGFITILDSDEVMMIQTRELEKNVLKYSGTAITGFLAQRIIKRSWNPSLGAVVLNVSPMHVASWLVANFAAPGYSGLMELDQVVDNGVRELIPHLVVDFPDVGVYGDSVYLSVEPGNLYDAVKSISDSYSLGFKIVAEALNTEDYILRFQQYDGRDLTGSVQFSSALDTLTNTKEFESSAGYKNVAYAFASNIPVTSSYVGVAYATPDDEFKLGFDRRTLLVDVTDIQEGDVDLTTPTGRDNFRNLLNQRARDALANNNYVKLLDGQIVPQAKYKYGIHYSLGDIIGLASSSGTTAIARVTEYIRQSDKNGFRAFPTLSVLA